jgi:hypothetical protein
VASVAPHNRLGVKRYPKPPWRCRWLHILSWKYEGAERQGRSGLVMWRFWCRKCGVWRWV